MRMRTSKELQDRLQELFPVHYRNGNILMINADCMEVMKHIKEKEVELSCVDPPYGIGISTWDSAIPPRVYFNELFRVSKNQIIWGGNYFNLINNSNFIVWNKKPFLKTQNECEIAYCSLQKTNTVYDYQYAGNFENGKVDYQKEKLIHICQKPVALYKWLLSRYAKPGDRILDTHGGSGSICIACHDLGFDLTWMELDEDYYKAAVARYKNHAAQATLFAPAELTKATETTPELFSDGSEAEE